MKLKSFCTTKRNSYHIEEAAVVGWNVLDVSVRLLSLSPMFLYFVQMTYPILKVLMSSIIVLSIPVFLTLDQLIFTSFI
jgi:hypothetical protein